MTIASAHPILDERFSNPPVRFGLSLESTAKRGTASCRARGSRKEALKSRLVDNRLDNSLARVRRAGVTPATASLPDALVPAEDIRLDKPVPARNPIRHALRSALPFRANRIRAPAARGSREIPSACWKDRALWVGIRWGGWSQTAPSAASIRHSLTKYLTT